MTPRSLSLSFCHYIPLALSPYIFPCKSPVFFPSIQAKGCSQEVCYLKGTVSEGKNFLTKDL